MGTKPSCISSTGTEPKNTAKTNVQRMSSSSVNEKMGTKQSSIFPTGIEPKNTAKTNAHRMFLSPVVSPKTHGEAKRPKPRDRHMDFHTFDDMKENASKDLDERSIDVSRPGNEAPGTDGSVKAKAQDLSGSQNKSLARNITSNFQTQNPRSNDVSKPETEVPRNDVSVKAWRDLFEIENKQVLDLTNEDQKKQPHRKKKRKRHLKETRIADDIKTAESNENHAASSSNDMYRFHENERNVKRLDVRVAQLSAVKDELFTRVADDIKTAESNENHHTASLPDDLHRDHKYERNVKRLEARVSQLSAEKDKLLNRLSEVGAIKLTDHNPNVTNLGDPQRPEKVVEELSETYDNKWTDAYEYLTIKRKENTDLSVKRLLQILQEVFTICMSSTEKKTKKLREAITNYVGLTKEDQDDLELKDIENRIREYRRKKLQNNFKRTEEEVGDQLIRILTKEIFDDLSEYIRSCVSICWKLCTKEPPMYLDFGDWKESAQSSNKTSTKMHFDKAKFMSYTKPGNYIDYVVWPAVYLFKDGPLMKKGVAQGIKDDKDESYKPAY